MSQQITLLLAFDGYREALLAWNDAVKNHKSDTGKIRKTATTYKEMMKCKQALDDLILEDAGVKRYYKRSGEGMN